MSQNPEPTVEKGRAWGHAQYAMDDVRLILTLHRPKGYSRLRQNSIEYGPYIHGAQDAYRHYTPKYFHSRNRV